MGRVQVVVRRRPRQTVYVRAAPVTIARPTPAQAELRLLFTEAIREVKNIPPEEIARMVGGRVVYVDGKPRIELPDGRALLPHQAYVKAVLSGYRSPQSRGARVPVWLEELERTVRLAVQAKEGYKLQLQTPPRER